MKLNMPTWLVDHQTEWNKKTSADEYIAPEMERESHGSLSRASVKSSVSRGLIRIRTTIRVGGDMILRMDKSGFTLPLWFLGPSSVIDTTR